MSTKKKTTILLSKQNTWYMTELTKILKSFGFEIIGEATSERDVFKALKLHSPDILFYDLYLSNEGVEKPISKIIKEAPKTKIIVTGEDYPELIDLCVECGCHGFFDEDIIDIELLINSIRRIKRGENVILTRKNRLIKQHL